MTIVPTPIENSALSNSRRPTSGLAVAAVVLAFVLPLAGVALGFVARSRIRRTGEAGSALAATAITVGVILVAFAMGVIGFAAYRLATTGRLMT
jgi:hypothetical protein